MNFDTAQQQAAYEENQALISAYLEARDLDARPGTVNNEFTVKPCAAVFAGSEASFSATLDNLDIQEAEDAYAAQLLKNYNLEVQSAGPGTGNMIMFTDSDEDLVIRKSVSFKAGSYNIILNRDYIGTVDYDAEISSELYLPLKKYNEELYYMIIPGTTLEDVTSSILPGTSLTPSQSVTGLVSAEVATTFLTTQQPRTLEDLKNEVANGVSAKIMAGPAHIKALLEESDEISVIDSAVVGMNDPEMLRDNKNIYGASSGGYVDIYVKTADYAHTKEFTKTAQRVSPGRYSIFINKDDAPGFYNVLSVAYGESTKTSDISMFSYTFGVDQTDALFQSYFPSAKDARFSPYQNCVVEFNYTGIDPDIDNPQFTVEVAYMPNIDAVQDFVSDPETRSPAADYVVKGAVPVFMSIEVVVSYPISGDLPDETIIQNTVAEAVNNVPQGQSFLSGAEIACAIQNIYPDVIVKLPVILDGFMFDNAGTLIYERSINTLTVPDLPEQGITYKTTAFMVNPSDVNVKIIGDRA